MPTEKTPCPRAGPSVRPGCFLLLPRPEPVNWGTRAEIGSLQFWELGRASADDDAKAKEADGFGLDDFDLVEGPGALNTLELMISSGI